MYSQNELDEAVAAGAISAEAAAALRAHIERQRSPPTVDEEQFRLITGFNDIFVAIAAAILLFAVGFIGQWIGQRTRARRSTATARRRSRRSRSPRPAGALALFFTAKRRMALPSILLLLAFVGSVFATAGIQRWCWPSARTRSTTIRRSAACSAPLSAAIAAGRRLAPLEALPGADHRRRRRRLGRRPSPSACSSPRSASSVENAREPDPRLRPAARHRHLPVRHVVGRLGPGAHHPPLGRRLLAPPAGGADDRPPGLHPARAQRRHARPSAKASSSSCSTS